MPRRSQRFGKYRGTVVNNVDPQDLGRIQLMIPDVYGATPAPWAMPCTPVAAAGAGMIAIPPIGATVWVEFERGDDDHPIWVGGFWPTAAEFPRSILSSPFFGIAFKTPGGHSLVISDAPGPAGGIVLRTAAGAALTFNDTGIHISNGQGASVTLVGPTVSVNNDALEVT
ncbi:baseplate assembly protein [Sphingomonas alpina]|uniref:Baseplate assembly protein n=3 Tax=Sphingomonas alpina TaxID=653931 RepID=A0A7H0LKV1_9SPHN|nr:baseplate assembly protein [Sphingomonas alpina]